MTKLSFRRNKHFVNRFSISSQCALFDAISTFRSFHYSYVARRQWWNHWRWVPIRWILRKCKFPNISGSRSWRSPRCPWCCCGRPAFAFSEKNIYFFTSTSTLNNRLGNVFKEIIFWARKIFTSFRITFLFVYCVSKADLSK